MPARLPAPPALTGRSRGKTVSSLVGILLLVTGLACLGDVAYQLVGTNVIAERAFKKEAEQARAHWQQAPPRGSLSAGSSRPAQAGRRQPRDAEAFPGDVLALLRIPALGSHYEVPILAGTSRRQLSRGVGHYSGTAAAGQIGNFALAGHRITHGQPFARLLDLRRGDQVVVETATSLFTYVLDTAPRDLTVPASAGWVLDPVPGHPTRAPTRATITLTTCQDLFHSSDRSVAFGHLARTVTK